MTVEHGLVNAELRRKRPTDLAQSIQIEHGADIALLRRGLLDYPYPHAVPEWHRHEITAEAVQGAVRIDLVASTAPDGDAPAPGVGIWELTVRTSDGSPLPKSEAEGWARALFGYRCAPLVYRRRSGGGMFRRPTGMDFVVHHGEHGPMHPSDVEEYGARV